MPENGQVKTDVELLKRDMELVSALAEKFDIAIDRLTEVSTSVDKMLAVHEMRLENQEQQREILQRYPFMKEIWRILEKLTFIDVWQWTTFLMYT